MNIVIRTDASLDIGTGHVMRCLTLAQGLVAMGAQCHFICRVHPGNLIEHIRAQGHSVDALPLSDHNSDHNSDHSTGDNQAAHTERDGAPSPYLRWLGATPQQDLADCQPILQSRQPDWLIVDHYALDAQWEKGLRSHCHHLMVIDDLANRPHDCDLLLDQTFGRHADHYHALVPTDSQQLCGSHYALLRPEFAALRPYSLQRRATPQLRKLLITMGGVDQGNAAGQILQALPSTTLPDDCDITIVLGAHSPWRQTIEQQARALRWPTQVLTNVSNMAQLMADSDLAIGAAGTTSWERCCLGLPTAMVVLADNQRDIAHHLINAGAARGLQLEGIAANLQRCLAQASASTLYAISTAAAGVCDGLGNARVIAQLMNAVHHAH